MRNIVHCGFSAALLIVILGTPVAAQKVKIGYDKSADFSKYRTYTLTEPAMPPTRPILYSAVVSSIETQLSAKGLERVPRNGDLVLTPSGGVDFGIAVSGGTPVSTATVPAIDATMWTGAGGSGELMPAVGEANLHLEFVDPSMNRIVWAGSVEEKLDPTEKEKSLRKAMNAVTKLLKTFPSPNTRSK
jgi:hypothetical protein